MAVLGAQGVPRGGLWGSILAPFSMPFLDPFSGRRLGGPWGAEAVKPFDLRFGVGRVSGESAAAWPHMVKK